MTPSTKSRLVLSTLSLLLFIALVELVLYATGVDTFVQNRFFVLNRALDYPDVFEKDQKLFWRFRPDREITSRFFRGRTYHINSLGLRGDEVREPKTGQRIVAIGNSCTFGWGQPDSLIFTTQLGRLLGQGYDVINAGIPGYSSYQGRVFFERDLIPLQPDIVLIMFGWNDHWAAASGIADKDQQFPPEAVIDLQNALSHLRSYRLIKKLWLTSIEPHSDSLFDTHSPIYRVSLVDFRENLIAICRTARANGIEPILMTSPVPALELYYAEGVRAPMHAFHRKYNGITRSVAEQEQVRLVDLAAEFDRQGGLWDDAEMDPIHFNAAGHRLAAELIARVILEKSDGN